MAGNFDEFLFKNAKIAKIFCSRNFLVLQILSSVVVYWRLSMLRIVAMIWSIDINGFETQYMLSRATMHHLCPHSGDS